METSCTAKATTLRKNQFPQLREYTELSGTSEVEGENKEERERERKEGRKKGRTEKEEESRTERER